MSRGCHTSFKNIGQYNTYNRSVYPPPLVPTHCSSQLLRHEHAPYTYTPTSHSQAYQVLPHIHKRAQGRDNSETRKQHPPISYLTVTFRSARRTRRTRQICIPTFKLSLSSLTQAVALFMGTFPYITCKYPLTLWPRSEDRVPLTHQCTWHCY